MKIKVQIPILLCFFMSFSDLKAQSLGQIPFDYNYAATGLAIAPIQSPRFFFQGLGTINTTEQLNSSIQGSQNFKLTTRLRKQRPGWGNNGNWGWDVTVGMNLLNLKPTGIDRDSFDIASLMFPETGNFGLMLSPVFHWYLSQDANNVSLHRVSSEASFSLRQNKVDNLFQRKSDGTLVSGPETVHFSVININIMPIRYNFFYQPDDDFKLDFNLGIYWNTFNIPDEDANNFNKLFPTDDPLFKSKTSRIEGLGCKLSCGVNGFLIFADIRYNYSTNAFRDENPFKGTMFNAGIAQNIGIFKR